MTDAERDALITRLEAEARRDPEGYRRRVVLLAAAGYAYLGAVLLGTLALVAVLVSLLVVGRGRGAALLLKLVWPLAALAVVVLRGMWVRFDPPRGVRLERGRFPQLDRLIDETRRAVSAPRVHEVLLTPDLNAAVVQRPRLGVFGWPQNYLLLGLPLLDGTTAEEARAVLAHELGHLSAADGSLGGWIYRTRAAWGRLMGQLEQKQHMGAGVLRSFFRWYAPFFDAYSFVAARAQERAADAWGKRLAGGKPMADVLVRLRLLDEALGERYWPAVYARALHAPQPDRRPFVEMADRLQSSLDPGAAQRVLETALARVTTHDDTHPCLRERLEAIGEPPRLPDAVAEPASAALLGAERAALAARLDEGWLADVREGWRRRFEEEAEARKRLAELDAAAAGGRLPADEAFERARLTEQVTGPEAALPLFRAGADEHPGHGPLRYSVARLLLDADQEEGLEWLPPLFEGPDEAIGPAHRLAAAFLERHGRAEEARAHLEKAEAWETTLEAARAERAELRLSHPLTDHGLPAERVERLRQALEATGQVRRAWLSRRELQHLPQRPLFVLVVERRTAPLVLSRKRLRRDDLALQERVLREVELPGEAFVSVVNHAARRQKKALTRVPGSRILPRG